MSDFIIGKDVSAEKQRRHLRMLDKLREQAADLDRQSAPRGNRPLSLSYADAEKLAAEMAMHLNSRDGGQLQRAIERKGLREYFRGQRLYGRTLDVQGSGVVWTPEKPV